jgi:hypothetical protein
VTDRLMSTAELARFTGLSARTLQILDEAGTVKVGFRIGSRGGRFRGWGPYAVRRVLIYARISPTGNHGFKRVLAKIPDAMIEKRFLVFNERRRLIAATDDAKEAIGIGVAAQGGIRLVEMPS